MWGWARLLLDHRRDLIAHGPRATRSAGGKFDDEEQQRHDHHHHHHHHHHYPEHIHARASDVGGLTSGKCFEKGKTKIQAKVGDKAQPNPPNGRSPFSNGPIASL